MYLYISGGAWGMMTMLIGAKYEVSQATRTERTSEDETTELQDRHPTPSAYVNSADDDDIARPDTTFPDAPRVRGSRVWLTIL